MPMLLAYSLFAKLLLRFMLKTMFPTFHVR